MTTPDLSWILRNVDEMNAATDAALQKKRETLTRVYAYSAVDRTFENTIAALQYGDNDLSSLQQQLDLLISVHPDETIRNAAQTCADRIDEENVKMDFDHRLWSAVSEWSAHREALEPAEQKLADDTVRDLKRMGFALKPEPFAQLKENITTLRKLQTEFEKAINDWEDHIVIRREQLAGLPERFINGLTREGDGYRVSLEYPDFFPFMRHADDDTARRELATKNLLKGGRENVDRLSRMVRLRQENAALLGYASHADFVAEPRMVKTAAAVQKFLEGIIPKLMPAARAELADLAQLKQRTRGAATTAPVEFHETGYWGYKLQRERYDVDAELVKEYFPLQRVIDGMFDVYQTVLGLQFKHVPDAKLWHPDAQLYEVTDGSHHFGHFIFDLYPRKGKYGHAAAFPIVLGHTIEDGVVRTGLVALVCNFPKPTDDNPSLMAHDEVETLLHEFGHVMHALVSGGRWQRQNGFGVPLDFVEAPSQLFEEWGWNPDVMAKLSGHYRTGAPIPSELQQKLISARHHMDGNYYLQQAVKALYDSRLHSSWPVNELDADALAQGYRSIRREYESMETPVSSLFPAGWSHMADYDAGYYSYLWSKAYALDLYTQFEQNPLDPTIGARYRRTILEPGASRSERDLVVEFLGRQPTQKPFFASLGIGDKVDITV